MRGAWRRRRSPGPRRARSGAPPARPCRSRIASPESFQPWLSRPRFDRRSYSMKPSPSRSPHSSIQRSAASAFGHSRSTRSRSPVQSKRLAEQDQPQGRRVDAAVVRPERQLAGTGHLAGAQLVEDLAGLGVAPVVVLGCLACGEHPERLDRDLGPEREELERGDDRVAAEQRREPRHARRDVALAVARAVVHEQAQVGEAPRDDQVEHLVVRLDPGRAAHPGVIRGGALARRRSAAGPGRAVPASPPAPPSGAQRSTRPSTRSRAPGRARAPSARTADRTAAPSGVVVTSTSPADREGEVVRRPARRGRCTGTSTRPSSTATGSRSPRPRGIAADLEDVCGVVGELQRDFDRLHRARRSSRSGPARAGPRRSISARARRPSVVPVWPLRRAVLPSGFGLVGFAELDRCRGTSPPRPGGARAARRSGATPADRIRVSSRYRPEAARVRVDVAELVGEQEDVECLRAWTLPRSVAGTIGARSGREVTDGRRPAPRAGRRSRRRPARHGAGGLLRRYRAPSPLHERPQPLRLVGRGQCVDQPVEVALEHTRQVVQVQPDPVIGHAILGVVVGPDLLGPVAAADHDPPRRGASLPLPLELGGRRAASAAPRAPWPCSCAGSSRPGSRRPARSAGG